MTCTASADLLVRGILAGLLAANEANLGVEEALSLAVVLAEDVLGAPEAPVGKGAHVGLAALRGRGVAAHVALL